MSRSFNGTSDYINGGNGAIWSSPGILNGITYSCWVYLNAVPGAGSYYGVVGKQGVGYALFYIAGGGKLAGYVAGGNQIDPGNSALSPSQWYHLAMTYQDSNGANSVLTLYINGQVDKSNLGPIASLNISTGNLAIGYDAITPGRNLPGRMANVCIWHDPLSPAEIGALAQGFHPPLIRPTACIAYYPLDGIRNPEPDLSGYMNNGILNGTSGPSPSPFGPAVTLTEMVLRAPAGPAAPTLYEFMMVGCDGFA